MHEMELQMGLQSGSKDTRGIHRLRLAALQMQNLAQENEKGQPKVSDDALQADKRNNLIHGVEPINLV
jgi:hypothetical protein